MPEIRFSYYGRMPEHNHNIYNFKGVHVFMLEELIINTLSKIENKLSNDIKLGLEDLRKELENEIKKQNLRITELFKFKDNLEDKEKELSNKKLEEVSKSKKKKTDSQKSG